MHIQNYILLLEAGLLFALAFYVLLRNPGQKIPQAFFVTSIGAGIWVISNAIFEITQSLIFGKTTFAGAILIVVGFYFLTNYFPYQYRRVSIFERYLVLAVAIILGIVLYTSNWFVTRVVSKDVLGFDIFYHIFAIYFVLIWLWSIYNLAIKYKMANGVHRLQIKYLFLAIIFSFFAGITTNLILPWIFDYQLFGWIGPSFTIVFFGFSAFILFEKKVEMIAHGVILLIIALLETILGLYIFNRDRKNDVNITFLLLTIGVLVWVSANSVLAFSAESVDNWYKLAYFAGIIICSSFLYFSWVFPYRLFFTNWLRKLITIVPTLVFAYLFFLTDTLIVNVKKTDLIAVVNYGNLFALYIVVFVVYFGWAFYSLIKKYQRSNGMHRWQLKYVILSALIPVVVNFITDIVLPWSGYSRQPWMVYIGSELSAVWLGLTAYVVFKKKISLR